jgi:hypothetical protein
MRVRRTIAALAAGVGAIGALAGCGSSAAPPAKSISLSITAPTNGATVGVRQVQIAGNVTPGTAAVSVGGRAAKVTHGAFTLPVQLGGKSQTITVTARASGYEPATSTTTVNFSGQTAAQIKTARVAATADRAFALSPGGLKKGRAGHANSGPVKRAFVWPGSGSTTGGSGSGSGSGSGGSGSGSGSGGSGSGSGSGGSGSGSGGGGPTTGTGSTPAPPPPIIWTAGKIHRVYVDACVRGNGGASVKPFCECTYKSIAHSGALRSREALFQLFRELDTYDHTHNVNDLPGFVENAVLDCMQDLPGNNVNAPLPIIPFPGLHHPAPGPQAHATG